MSQDDIAMCTCGHSLAAHDEERRCEFCDCQQFEDEE